MNLADLDTPTLILDLNGLEDNLDRYQRYFDSHKIGLRPHIKTHRCLTIAHMQMRRGAIGITCQKLGEAEVMVAGGITGDILIPYNIIGPGKLERLANLARQAEMTVAVDSEYTVQGLADTAQTQNVRIGVVIELFRGRTGVATPERAVELAQAVDRAPGLTFRGVMIMPSPPEVRPFIQQTLERLDRAGLPHPVVSGGSTPGALLAHEIPELTEYRAGEYAVGGAGHYANGTHSLDQCCLRVLTTVVSRAGADGAILDAGSKALSASVAQRGGQPYMGYIVEYPDAILRGASEEHGHVDLSSSLTKPEIGERVQVLPVHPCPCVNEHDEIVAVRDGHVEAIWPVHARGKSK